MNVVLDMAISPNGMIARENGDEDWLPEEGWNEFLAEAKKYKNIVMGRETYQLVSKNEDDYSFSAVETELKIIVTKDPAFTAPDGYVVVNSPRQAMKVVQEHGLPTLFLIGGGKLNGAFLAQGLVDEIHLTINPYIISKGRLFTGTEDFDLSLELIGSHAISGDRISVQYRVVKGEK